MMPNTDGRSIVYVQDGYIHVLDVAVRPGPQDRRSRSRRTAGPCATGSSTRATTSTRANLANDGKTVILEARGDVFRVPGRPRGRPTTSPTRPGTREMYPALSPDGKTWPSSATRPATTSSTPRASRAANGRPLTTDLDRTVYKLALVPRRQEDPLRQQGLRHLLRRRGDQEAGQDRFLQPDEERRVLSGRSPTTPGRPTPSGSPTASSSTTATARSSSTTWRRARSSPVTDDFYDNLYPAFDANGKYLYYVSSRNFDVQMDFYEDNHVLATPQQVMVVQLRDGEKPPFAAGRAAGREGRQEGRGRAVPHRHSTAWPSGPIPCPSRPGNYFYLKAGKGKVLWASVDAFTENEYEEIFKPKTGRPSGRLHIFDMAEKREAVLDDKIRDFSLSANGEQLLIRREDDDVFTTSASTGPSPRRPPASGSNLSGLVYTVDLQKEWHQIFNDAWRWYRDFFYDAELPRPRLEGHGRQVPGLHPLPLLARRAQLGPVPDGRRAVRLPHLHRRRRLSARRPRPARRSSPACSGADLVADAATGLYKLAKIYGPTDINLNLTGPLVRPDIAVKEGDYLLAINGTPLKAGDDYFKLLQTTRRPEDQGHGQRQAAAWRAPRPTRSSPSGSDSQLRYFRWIEDNIEDHREGHAAAASATCTSTPWARGGIGEFDKYWRAFRYKDGVIIDVRRNSRRLDGVLPDRQARAGHDRPERPARHGPLPLSRLGRQRQLRRHLQREQRLGRRGLRRALQGPQAGDGRGRARPGAAWSASSTSS